MLGLPAIVWVVLAGAMVLVGVWLIYLDGRQSRPPVRRTPLPPSERQTNDHRREPVSYADNAEQNRPEPEATGPDFASDDEGVEADRLSEDDQPFLDDDSAGEAGALQGAPDSPELDASPSAALQEEPAEPFDDQWLEERLAAAYRLMPEPPAAADGADEEVDEPFETPPDEAGDDVDTPVAPPLPVYADRPLLERTTARGESSRMPVQASEDRFPPANPTGYVRPPERRSSGPVDWLANYWLLIRLGSPWRLVAGIAGPILIVMALYLLVSSALGGGDDSRPSNAIEGGIATPTRAAGVVVASPTVVRPVASPTPAPSATNRRDCAAIRGTDYRSDEERQWFIDNCTGAAPTAAVSTPTRPAGTPPGTQSGTPAAPGTVVATPNPVSFLGSTTPPANFCTFAPCVQDFESGTGYVVQCGDGFYSKTGGRSGACGGHSGVFR